MLLVQKAEPILIVLLWIMERYSKEYCFLSQEKLLELLKRYRKVTISRATLNRYLRAAEDAGLIKRVKRIKKHHLYGMVFKSSLQSIPLKGLIWMRSLGHNVSKHISILLEKLRFKYPEFATKVTKKMLDDTKPNPKHAEHTQKILNSLADNLTERQ